MNPLLIAILLTASVPDTSADARTLLRLEDDWARALVRRDTAVFQRMLAAGFVYTENDRMMSRAEVLRGVVSAGDTVTAARNDSMQVHRFGATALVTGWLIVQGRDSNGSYEHRYRFTDTWVKRGSRWRIVGAQDFLAPAKPPS
jgi:ketosteroid isomerase-like protein